MHIAGMTKEDWAWPYTDETAEFVFHPRANVFIGPNASGKTSLLRALRRRLAPRVDDDRYEGVVSFAYHLSDDAPGFVLKYSEDWLGYYQHDWDADDDEDGEFVLATDLLRGRTVFVDAGRRAASDLPMIIPDRWTGFVSFTEFAPDESTGERISSYYDLMLIQQRRLHDMVLQISSSSIDDRFNPDDIDRAIENIRQTHGTRNFGGLKTGDPNDALRSLRDEVSNLVELSHRWDYDASDVSVEDVVSNTGQDFLTIYAAYKHKDEYASHVNERFEHVFGKAFWVKISDEDLFMHASGFRSRAHANFMQCVYIAHLCAKDICREIVSPALPQDSESTHRFVSPRGVPEVEGRLDVGTQINTSDTYRNPQLPQGRPRGRMELRLDIADLSSGTGETLCWIRSVALQLLAANDFEFGWDKQPAVLLIDEVENHLHPTWQRRVIPALLKYFPGLQIFATTHSPFVVAGLKMGQVHMLKRDANGVVTASTNEQDIIGWTTDEILRTFMGVDEPTDQLTIDRAQRLKELRGKESLNQAESAEMEDLRRQINADFLSSVTPLGRERERLGDMMLDFLHARQSELSQDGD